MRRGETLAASATVGRRLIEAGLSDAAVCLSLWAEISERWVPERSLSTIRCAWALPW